LVCIESGCDSLEGLPIKQCVFAGGGACHSNEDWFPARTSAAFRPRQAARRGSIACSASLARAGAASIAGSPLHLAVRTSTAMATRNAQASSIQISHRRLHA
jgi:hypothetical protein